MSEQFDIVIVGGGLVGASMALALANSRFPRWRCWKTAHPHLPPG